jgi:NTP pyrophosphatase (non-canonical NTP hydrolase)
MKRLRAANIARHEVWPGASRSTVEFSAIEFAGEAGELAEAYNEYLHSNEYADSIALLQALKEEIGDVFITIDLLARDLDIIVTGKIADKFVVSAPILPPDEREYALCFAGAVGKVMDGMKKYLRIVLGIAGNGAGSLDDRREFIRQNLEMCVAYVALIARDLRIDLYACTPMKFNKTSRKVGLASFMHPESWDYMDYDPTTEVTYSGHILTITSGGKVCQIDDATMKLDHVIPRVPELLARELGNASAALVKVVRDAWKERCSAEFPLTSHA